MKNPSPLILREQRMFEQAQRAEQERQEQDQRLRQERLDHFWSLLPERPPSYAQSVDRRPRNLLHQARGVPYSSRGVTYDRSRDPRLRRQSTGKKDTSPKLDPVDELVRMMGGMGSSSGRTLPLESGDVGVSTSSRSASESARTTSGRDSGKQDSSGDTLKNSTGSNSVHTSVPTPTSHGLNWVPASTPSSFSAAANNASSTHDTRPAPSSTSSSGVRFAPPPAVPNVSNSTYDFLTSLLEEAGSSSGVGSYPEPITYPSTALGGVPTPPASPPKDINMQSKAREEYSPVLPLSTLVSAVPDTVNDTVPGLSYTLPPTPAPSASHYVPTESQPPQVASQPQISLLISPTIPPIAPILPSHPPPPPIPSAPHLSTQLTPFTGPVRTIKTIHLLHAASPYAPHRPNYAPDTCSLNSNTPWDAFVHAQDIQDPITLDWNACRNASDPETNALALAHLDRAVERHYWTERWLKSCEMDGLDLDGNGVDDFAENGNLPPLTMLIPDEVKPIIFQRLCDLDDALTPPDLVIARLDAVSDPRAVVARAYMISDEARDRYRYIYKGFRLLTAQLLGCRKMAELFPTILDWDADLIIEGCP